MRDAGGLANGTVLHSEPFAEEAISNEVIRANP